MRNGLRDLDRLLRGEATRPSALRKGVLDVPIGGVAATTVALGMFYGLCMGSFSLSRDGGPMAAQAVSSAVKVPLLFVLTVLVTLPSLYVANALVGSRLPLSAMARLVVAALGVLVAVLASLGPVVAFFSVITTSHPFIQLLNVLVFGVSGVIGLRFLLQTTRRLNEALAEAPEPIDLASLADDEDGGILKHEPATPVFATVRAGERPDRAVSWIFRLWVVVFGLVGAQMSWVLRPFIGRPDEPFLLVARRESNFFEEIFRAIVGLFS